MCYWTFFVHKVFWDTLYIEKYNLFISAPRGKLKFMEMDCPQQKNSEWCKIIYVYQSLTHIYCADFPHDFMPNLWWLSLDGVVLIYWVQQIMIVFILNPWSHVLLYASAGMDSNDTNLWSPFVLLKPVASRKHCIWSNYEFL